jgi:hypothetical protein
MDCKRLQCRRPAVPDEFQAVSWTVRKLYYCEDCHRYYWPTPDGLSGEYLPAEEALAVKLAGRPPSLIRCDTCQDIAVAQYRLERGYAGDPSVAHFRRELYVVETKPLRGHIL